MFEKLIAKLDYLKPWKVIPALIEAVKKAKDEKDKGFFEKIGIFWMLNNLFPYNLTTNA